jgi:hypothetical protein
MVRFEPINTKMKLLPIDPFRQLLPGTFENAVSVQTHVSRANVKRSGRD